MTHAQHIEFARQFGELTPGHAVYGSDSEYPEIYPISKNRSANHFREQVRQRPWTGWHCDITAAINPPMASILRGDIVPPYGGDTQFTNLMAAYNALSPVMQTFVNGLRGVFRNGMAGGANVSKEYAEQIKNRTLETEHPLVRVHPETGERALLCSSDPPKRCCGPDANGKFGGSRNAVGASLCVLNLLSVSNGNPQSGILG